MSTHSTQVLEGLLRESRLCGVTPLDEVVRMRWQRSPPVDQTVRSVGLDAIDLHADFLHESRFYDEKRLDEVFRMRGQRLPAESHRGGPAFGRSYLTHLMKTFRLSM